MAIGKCFSTRRLITLAKWPIVRLGDYIVEQKRRNRQLVCRRVYSVTNSDGFVPSGEYFKKQVFSEDIASYKLVDPGMIAFNPSRINVGSVALLESAHQVCVSPLYTVFSVDEKAFRATYVLEFLKSSVGNSQIRALTSGSVRDSLKYSALKKIRLPLPPIGIQESIIRRLSGISGLIEERNKQNNLMNLLVQSRFQGVAA